jgi:aminoglycoside phosphotransferase family enzyme
MDDWGKSARACFTGQTRLFERAEFRVNLRIIFFANDLALLKADGRFAPVPIAASRTVNLGGTVATVGY